MLVASCLIQSGALDSSLWCSSTITCNITSIAHDKYTDIYSLLNIHIYILHDAHAALS